MTQTTEYKMLGAAWFLALFFQALIILQVLEMNTELRRSIRTRDLKSPAAGSKSTRRKAA